MACSAGRRPPKMAGVGEADAEPSMEVSKRTLAAASACLAAPAPTCPAAAVAAQSAELADAELDQVQVLDKGDQRDKDEPKEVNELLAVVQLIACVVHFVVEGITDTFLLLLLVVPVLVPWRTLEVVATAVPADRSEGWRKEFRHRAACHIICALLDLLLAPFLVAIFVVPTRTWPILEALVHRHEIQYVGNDPWSQAVKSIRYKKDLRTHFSAQVVGGIIDILCIVPAIFVVVTPWRLVSFAKGACTIFSEVAPLETAYSPENFNPSLGQSRWMVTLEEARSVLLFHAVGILSDVPCFLCGLVSLFHPTRGWALVAEVIRLQGDPTSFRYGLKLDKHMDIFNWRALHKLCVFNLGYALLDTVVLPLAVVVVFTIIRAAPLLTMIQRDWANSPGIVKVELPFHLTGGGRVSRLHTSRGANERLSGSSMEGFANKAAALSGSVARVRSSLRQSLNSLEALAEVPASAAEPPVGSVRGARPLQSPQPPPEPSQADGQEGNELVLARTSTVSTRASTTQAVPDFPLAQEFNGTYLRSGMFRGGPFYRLMVHNLGQDLHETTMPVQPAKRPAFMGVWDGMWHLCLTQDPATAVIRFRANDNTRDPSEAFQSNKEYNSLGKVLKWERRRNPEAAEADPANAEEEWVTERALTSYICLSARGLNSWFSCSSFGHRRFNLGLRMHVLMNTGFLLFDIFLLPFFLLIMLTGYRFPAIVRMMRKDAEASIGAELGFGDKVDTSILSQTWVGDLGFSFGQHSRLEVMRQAAFIVLDLLMLPALLIITCTFYRLAALKGKFTYFSLSWHFHVLLQLNVLFSDVFLLLPALMVLLSVYRFRFVLKSKEEEAWMVSGVNLTIRFEIIRQCSFVFLDLLTAPFVLLVLATWYRLKYITGVFHPNNAAFHKAVLLSCLLLVHDMFLFSLVVAFCVIPFPRLFVIYVAMTDDLPVWYGRSEDAQWRSREEIYRQVVLGFLDILTLPAYLITRLTHYRWYRVSPHISMSFCLCEFDAFNEERGANLHSAAMYETLVILHDIILLGPACIVLLITYYRLAPVIILARSAWSSVAGLEDDDALEAEQGPMTARASELEQREQVATRQFATLPVSVSIDGTAAAGGTAGVGAGAGIGAGGSGGGLVAFGQDDTIDELGEMAAGGGANGGGGPEDAREADAELVRQEEQERRLRRRQDLRPERWRRITNELIEADPEWGELVNWNEAPLPNFGPSLRREVWEQFRALLCDGPFLIMGMFVCIFYWRLPTLVQLFRERPRVNDRRRATAWQLLMTFRDILVLPFFCLVLVTPRAPKVLAQLFCSRSSKNPLLLAPLIEVSVVEGHLPVKGAPSVIIRGRVAQSVGVLRRNSLHIQVVGEAFWQDLAHVRGRAKVGMLRLMLPTRIHEHSSNFSEVLANAEVRGGSETEVEINVTLPISVERAFVAGALAQLRLDTWLTIQLEATNTSGESQVVASVPLRVSDFVAAAISGSTLCSGESLGDADVRQQCLESQHQKGPAEIFAGLVFVELFEFLVDILHVFAFLSSFLAPWRFLQLLVRLDEPKDYWVCHLCSAAVQEMEDLRAALQTLSGELLPLVNSMAKEPALVQAWCSPVFSGLDGLPLQVRQYKSDALREHKWLERSLRGKMAEVPQHIAGKIGNWLELQDARLYYTTLRSYANCLLSAGRICIEEHGIIIAAARDSEVECMRATARLGEDIETLAKESWEEAISNVKAPRGIWHKDVRMIRQITQRTAGEALSDLTGMCSALVVFVTLYHLPSFCKDLQAARWPPPTKGRFKALVARHVRAVFVDLGLFLQVCFLWLVLLVTLVRFAEAVSETLAVRQSMRSMRDLQSRNLKEVAQELWAMLTMYVLAEFAKTAIRCSLQLLLVPPACLNELMTRIIGHRVKLVIRFSACFAIFYTLTTIPEMLREFLPAAAVRAVFVLLLLALSLCNIASVAKSKAFTFLSEDCSPTLNVTWGNAISVCSIVATPASLILLLVGRHSTHLSISVDCGTAETLGILSVVLTALWLLVVSWIFLTQSGEGQSRTDLVVMMQLVLSHLLFVPLVIGLCAPGIGRCEEFSGSSKLPGLQSFLLSVLSVYLITTQMLSGASGTEHLSTGGRVDARYATLYIMVSQLADYVAVAVPMGLGSQGFELAMPAIAYLASAAWTLSYKRLLGCAPCPIRHLEAMRVGASLTVPWAVLCLLLEDVVGEEAFVAILLLGLVVIAGATAYAVRVMKRRARDQQREMVEKSGLRQAILRLVDQNSELCVAQSSITGWSEFSYRDRAATLINGTRPPKAIAYDLVSFQESILAERLSDTFLKNRERWLYDLRRACTFPQVTDLVDELAEGIRLPSTLPQMRLVALRLLRRQDLVNGFVELLVGHRRLNTLLGAALLATPSSSPGERPDISKANDGLVCAFLRRRLAGLKRTRLWAMLRKQRGGVNIASHCLHARVALEDVLYYFNNPNATPLIFQKRQTIPRSNSGTSQGSWERWQTAPTGLFAPPAIALAGGVPGGRMCLTWAFLTRDEGHVFTPSGELLEREPVELFQAGRPLPEEPANQDDEGAVRPVPSVIFRHAGTLRRRL